MSKPTTSLYLRKVQVSDLAKLAASRNYVQTRGAGTGETPSISQFIEAIGAGELVAIGPVARWSNVLSALTKIAATVDLLSEAEYEALDGIRQQVEREANFDDDDV